MMNFKKIMVVTFMGLLFSSAPIFASSYWKKFKSILPSAPKNVENAWVKISKAKVPENIDTARREENMQKFLIAAKIGNINDTLSYLWGARLTVFDETKKNKQNLFNALLGELRHMGELRHTPGSAVEKRALLIFVLHKMHMFSAIDASDEKNEKLRGEKENALKTASQEFEEAMKDEIDRKMTR